MSESVSGGSGGGDSASPSISGDGRYVAFESDATNLVLVSPGKTEVLIRGPLHG